MMIAQWKKFTGSDEQVSEILNAKDGLRYKDKSGKEHNVNNGWRVGREDSDEYGLLLFCYKNHTSYEVNIDEYMIYVPHPHAEMIIEWARTGREVYEHTGSETYDKWIKRDRPMWFPELKYSFNPDGDDK